MDIFSNCIIDYKDTGCKKKKQAKCKNDVEPKRR